MYRLRTPWKDIALSWENIRPACLNKIKNMSSFLDDIKALFNPAEDGVVVPELAACEWIGGLGNAFCRKEFSISLPPHAATLKVVADPHSYAIKHWQIIPSKYPYDNQLLGGSFIKYRVFLNGVLVAAGPFRSLQDGVPLLMEYDVTAHLKRGSNVIAVQSRGEARGFALALAIDDDEGGSVIVTSQKWRRREANTIYRPVCWERPGLDQLDKGGCSPGEYPEHIDGNAYPQGWKTAGFDDSKWSPAQGFGKVLDGCEVCQTPTYQLTQCEPVAVCRLGPDNYLADFGRPVFGGIELSGPAGGGAVELRLAEELQPNGHARYQLRTENCFQELWTFAPDSEALSHFGTRMFRYAEVVNWRGNFDASKIRALALGMPFDYTRSEFRCSERRLEEVWNLCKNTVAYTTADVFTDCLTRERLAYEGDAYVTMLTHFCAEGSPEVARRTLAYLVGHPTHICEWWQCYIPLFREYLLHSGDFDFVDKHYTFLRDQTTFHRRMVDGLISEFPLESLVDWPAHERDGFEFGPGNAVTNAFAHWDLQCLSDLAVLLGKENDAKIFAEQAKILRNGFNRRLYNEATGLYVDSLGSTHSSFHTNMYALRFGLVPEDRRERCMSFIKKRGMGCSVFGAQFLLEMLFMNNAADHAVALMASDGERSWLEMIRHGAVATTESWLATPKENMSWAHPWGSSPGNVIVRHLFGLRPTSPGWKTFERSPSPGGLETGHLRITTPRGPIESSFVRTGEGYHVTVNCGLRSTESSGAALSVAGGDRSDLERQTRPLSV